MLVFLQLSYLFISAVHLLTLGFSWVSEVAVLFYVVITRENPSWSAHLTGSNQHLAFLREHLHGFVPCT